MSDGIAQSVAQQVTAFGPEVYLAKIVDVELDSFFLRQSLCRGELLLGSGAACPEGGGASLAEQAVREHGKQAGIESGAQVQNGLRTGSDHGLFQQFLDVFAQRLGNGLLRNARWSSTVEGPSFAVADEAHARAERPMCLRHLVSQIVLHVGQIHGGEGLERFPVLGERHAALAHGDE